MGTVGFARRALVVLALLALVPAWARGGTSSVGPPYTDGPRGGDTYNRIESNAATGEMTILRNSLNAPLSGGLGCGGQGGFAYFALTHDAGAPVSSVAALYRDALVGPYAFVSIGVRQADRFLNSRVERGVKTGTGSVTVDLPSKPSGPLTIWFGFQISSACPPSPAVEVAHAVFSSLAFTTTG